MSSLFSHLMCSANKDCKPLKNCIIVSYGLATERKTKASHSIRAPLCSLLSAGKFYLLFIFRTELATVMQFLTTNDASAALFLFLSFTCLITDAIRAEMIQLPRLMLSRSTRKTFLPKILSFKVAGADGHTNYRQSPSHFTHEVRYLRQV